MSKARNTGNLNNSIQISPSGDISFVNGSTTLATINTTGQLSGSSPVLSSSYATTATTASYANSFTVTGNLTAQTLVVQTITSSVDFVTGSTRFGSLAANTHTFTGSVLVSGSINGYLNGQSLYSSYLGGYGTNQIYTILQPNGNLNGPVIKVRYDTGTANRYIDIGAVDGNGTYSEGLKIYNLSYMTFPGSVGIGTNDPSFGKLSILGTDNTTISSAVWGTSTGAGIVASVYNASQTTDSVAGIRLITRNSGASVWNIYNISRGNDAGDLAFGNGSGGSGTEKVRITNTGNVGIGTNNPAVKLQIDGSLTLKSNTNQTIQLWNSGSVAANIGGTLEFRGTYRNSDNDSVVYSKIFGGKENASDGNFAGYMSFSTYQYPNSLAERMRITSDGITQVSNLRTSTIYSEYTKNLSGAYSAGTYYEIVNSSQIASGVYIVKAYVDTFGIGGGTYFCTYVSVPFFFYTQGTNNTGAMTLPTMLGSGHAGLNPPIIRIRLSSGGSGGLTYIEFDPNANWSNVTGVSGATVTFYVKRLGD